MCLSETQLESTILNDYPRLSLNGYTLIRAGHPSDIKRGGVCTFYKNHLHLTRKFGMFFFDECLVRELKVGRKKCLSQHYRDQWPSD